MHDAIPRLGRSERARLHAVQHRPVLGDLTWNVHCDDAYAPLREQFGERLIKLQFRYQDPSGKCRGGIVVSDRRTAQSSRLICRDGKPVAAKTVIPGQQTSPREAPHVS
ncbi:hypothetical protein [Streptomyces sp. NPDC088727]|uniref:hypothetical protein n=1 Tax=Streptomyces sp. NPDC088727 TaxID=3365875 RepID=UPI0037FAC707